MRWHGYRSENRYQVFQCLTHTLGLEAVQWRVLDQAHRKRNLAEYEGELDVDDALVEALVRVGRTVAERVVALRSEEHTSELQSLMRHSYAVFCLKKKKNNHTNHHTQS